MKNSYMADFDAMMRRRFMFRFIVWYAVLSLIYSVGFTPIQLWLTSDILLQNTVLPTVVDLFMSVLNFAFYWIAFAYLIYAVARFPVYMGGILIAVFAGFDFLRYALSQLMSYWVLHNVFEWIHIRDILLYVLFDLLMLGVVLWISFVKNRHFLRQGGLAAQMPFARLLAFKKPLSRMVLLVAAIPSGIHLITRLIYDLSALGGMPVSLFDLIWVLVGYVSEFVFAFVGYMIIILLLNAQVEAAAKAKMNFENTVLLEAEALK